MANQTLVSLPTKFEDFKQVRAFAVKLIEKLDTVLGYRGAVGYEEAGAAEALAQVTLASLAETVSEFEAALDAIRQDVSANADLAASYRTGSSVADTSYTAPTMAASYDQAEAQAVADNLQTVSAALDALLTALRSVEIIS